MLFLKAFVVGFGVTLGVVCALGLRYAIKAVKRSYRK